MAPPQSPRFPRILQTLELNAFTPVHCNVNKGKKSIPVTFPTWLHPCQINA